MASWGSLVVSRGPGKSVYLGDDITIQLVEIRKGKARLLIRAPHSTRVLRAELATDADIDRRIKAVVDADGWHAVRTDPILGPIWAARQQESKEFVDSVVDQ